MLAGTFYKLLSCNQQTEGNYIAAVELFANHKIFAGHFPGNPIVPGVCLTQMVKEIVEEVVAKKLHLKKADSLKFTAIINPQIDAILSANFSIKQLDNTHIQAELSFYSGSTTFFKFKGSFQQQL
ncbi:MAG TPA: 3-hydroxyacyl-ACP dehydratase [Bacteroidia bacterium]|nr:3-hydroxyacyl-ACP dehydratase [Bacteroidia bacterium]HRH07732.1 3-hydroxyacyl-ACP dehydratase [Bacteroidia bacterium]HRH61909.1 3-hydroxyacyl-ACP dehydratase [Bacteroidia bacterium]